MGRKVGANERERHCAAERTGRQIESETAEPDTLVGGWGIRNRSLRPFLSEDIIKLLVDHWGRYIGTEAP